MAPVPPTVSVIIPTYNRAHLLGRALHSVLSQTYTALEVIVVDDGSTDDTRQLVMSFTDPRVRYVASEKRLGAAAARNLGISHAAAEFIAFQDSDDEWLCQKLEKQMEAFASAPLEVGVVYCGFFRIENKGACYYPPNSTEMTSGRILPAILKGNFVTTQASVVRRSALKAVGYFDERLPRFQDWELFIRLAKHCEFVCLDEPLLLAFHTESSITTDNSRIYQALKIILEKHEDLYVSDRCALARQYYDLAGAACLAGKMREGRGYFIKALMLNPTHWMCWVRVLTALPGQAFYRVSSAWIAKNRYKYKKS